jgi:hypothetical protein
VPTKRVKRTPARIGITPEVAEAWLVGDFHKVHAGFSLLPGDWSPFETSDAGPPPAWLRSEFQLASWRRGQELRRALIATVGRPGVPDRHGLPTGPAR